MNKKNLQRREFIRVLGLASISFSFIGCGSDTEERKSNIKNNKSSNWGGAPNNETGWTIAAFCDTVIPSSYRDPLRKPGALDVNAPALFFDPAIPATEFIPVLVFLLNLNTKSIFKGKKFYSLNIEQREKVLIFSEEKYPQMEFACQLARLAFYSSKEAQEYLGYPGENNGYLGNKSLSFNRSMSKEITKNEGHYF